MKMKRKANHKVNIKISSIIVYGLALLVLLNYLEIICKNVKPNPQYSSWNVLVNVTGYNNIGE